MTAMEIGASFRLASPFSPGEGSRPPVAPELDAPAAQAAPTLPSASPAPSEVHATGASDFIDRNFTVDIETRKVVFQAVDERTGDVVMQFPDPRYLKAYLEQMRAQSQDQPSASVERLA